MWFANFKRMMSEKYIYSVSCSSPAIVLYPACVVTDHASSMLTIILTYDHLLTCCCVGSIALGMLPATMAEAAATAATSHAAAAAAVPGSSSGWILHTPTISSSVLSTGEAKAARPEAPHTTVAAISNAALAAAKVAPNSKAGTAVITAEAVL